MSFPSVGVHYDVEPRAYYGASYDDQGRRIVSKSLLWPFFQNPWRWKHAPYKEQTPAMKWGNMVDCMLLTPERWTDQYVVAPETYDAPESTKKDAPMVAKPWNWNATACKEWREAQNGKQVLTRDEVNETATAVAAFQRKDVSEILASSKRQVAMRLDYEAIPGVTVPIKCLMDLVPSSECPFGYGNALVDLKTTGKLESVRQLGYTINDFGYHAQAALYLDVWNALTGEQRDRFLFIFQLSSAPYEVAVIELDSAAILQGRMWYQQALALWADCITRDNWPSPWEGIVPVSLPKYAQIETP